jgi:hypothetical protein
MNKEKRKTRLNKTQGTKGEFLGFGAFADAVTTPQNDSTAKPSPAKLTTLRWTPVYTGNNNHLSSLVFPRLIKRDATTKVKALQELQDYFQKDSLPKKNQVDALAHYIYVYYAKLSFDSSPSVRAEALLVMTAAAQRVPKAFKTLIQQNRQVLGMMYCCHGDPAAEVRAAATKELRDDVVLDEDSTYQDLEIGMWEYVQRILSYGRANKMHEDLFANSLKNTNGGGGGSNGNNSNEELNETQRDKMEERFERIVGTALTGMKIWIHYHGILGDGALENEYNLHNSTFLWKTLSSPKASLRRQTYLLLGFCCQKAPSIIFPLYGSNDDSGFSQSLPQALASEKEPGNFPALLEAFLAYLATFSANNSGASPWDLLNAGNVTKHLVRIFKKACFGASPSQWGPILLPLLAMFPSLQEQVTVLSAVWKGRDQTVRPGDHVLIASTVSECASFFLLRAEQQTAQGSENGTHGKADAKALAQLWLDCLESFLGCELSAPNSRPTAEQAQQVLGRTLARDLLQLDAACYDRPSSAVHAIHGWFWTEKIRPCILKSETCAPLAKIVNCLISESESSSQEGSSSCQSRSSRLSSILREKFGIVVSGFQLSSGSTPTRQAYALLIGILLHCGVCQVLNTESVEKFLINDVLRWMVIHTSFLSTQKQTKSLVQNAFVIYGICSAKLLSSEKRMHIWESLLKEVIAAKCNPELLLAGLVALLKDGKTAVEIEDIRCDTLDNYAIEVVRDAITQHSKDPFGNGSDHPITEEHYDEVLKAFLQTCAGLSHGVPSLVRPPVVTAWVGLACLRLRCSTSVRAEKVVPSPVLETLLCLSSSPQAHSMMATNEVQEIVLQSWRQGGYIWDEVAVKMLLEDCDECFDVFEQGSKILREILLDWSTGEQKPNLDLVAQSWSERAWRLLNLSKRAAAKSPEAKTPSPSLALVALSDVALWESYEHPDFVFSCLMYLLRHFDDYTERLELLQSGGIDIFVRILSAVSEASADPVAAERVSRRQDRCAQLLAALGGKRLARDGLAGAWLSSSLSSLKNLVQKQDIPRIRKSVAVISELVDLMIERVKPRDIFCSGDDDDAEALTEELNREKLARSVIAVIESNSFATLPWDSSYAELVNVVVVQCGLGSERGIGSLHYDTMQLLLGTHRRLHKLLTEDSDEDEIAYELWLLSLANGFGYNTPRSTSNSHLLVIDADDITASVLDYVEKRNKDEITKLGRAVVAWLGTVSTALKKEHMRSRSVTQIYRYCLIMLNQAVGFGVDSALALRAILVAQTVLREKEEEGGLDVQTWKKLLLSFSKWESEAKKRNVAAHDFDESCSVTSSVQPAWRSQSDFSAIVSSSLRYRPYLLVAAASDMSDEIAKALFIKTKRWFAFRFLHSLAMAAESNNNPTPDDMTARRMIIWTKGLNEEEEEELKEDIEIVSEILPHRFMTEMESWSEEDVKEVMDDEIVVGRMLIWLSCLRYIEAAAKKDASTRTSFCAYFDHCGAVESVLNLTLLHTGIGAGGNGRPATKGILNMEELLKSEGAVESTSLAAMVLCHTVEALPSLTRRWWEEECPKVYSSPIRDFIETKVAPLILQRELERIKFATIQNTFGAMSVTGSITTREITALYSQDEIQLRVQIRLPSCFPLRSAEVDCSQTLGVPQKRWKLWSLQITRSINQGGMLFDALTCWKENVDKEFDGVEPCPVCYSVLHIKTHKLPELECTTCSNRFHVQCLTQWFRSSGKTQCVICQHPWVGTRVKK